MDDPAFGRDSSMYLFRVISALEWLVDREIQVNVEAHQATRSLSVLI